MFKKTLKINLPTSLLLILILGLFLRIFRFSSLLIYGHEQDLHGWIVKDVIVDLHPRLIGQETSVTGLFIGPLFYYFLVPFYFVSGFDPRASVFAVALIAIVTTASVYYVFNKLFGKQTATIGALIYAASPAIVFLDRWIVATNPTFLWTIWFFYVVMDFAEGRLKTLPIFLILISLIWHIHIAFVPLLLLLPIALYFGKANLKKDIKKVNSRNLKIAIVAALVLIAPLIAFEFRHNFQQVKGVLNINKSVVEGGGREVREGYYKVEVITEYMNRVVWSPLVNEKNLKNPMIAKIPAMLFVFLAILIFVYKKKLLTKQQSWLVFMWIFITFLAQMVSTKMMSQYYFNNLIILSLAIFTLTLCYFYEKEETKKFAQIVIILVVFLGFKSAIFAKPKVGEFVDKNAIVEYISKDAKKNGYECVGINYIGDIPVRFGYRFLFWKNKVDLVTPGNDVPVYSIVQPSSISESEVEFISGNIGVILPRNLQLPSKDLCNDPSRQLLPLNGFVN